MLEIYLSVTVVMGFIALYMLLDYL